MMNTDNKSFQLSVFGNEEEKLLFLSLKNILLTGWRENFISEINPFLRFVRDVKWN